MENTSEKTVETIKMVERALTVLDILRTSNKQLGVNEIAKLCEIGPSTTYRILKTLELEGWIFQMPNGRYISGQKLSFVLENNNLYLALREVASFTMKRLALEHNQPMNLIVRDCADCYVLQQARSRNLVDYVPTLHSAVPFYACACGKILLSELPINLVNLLMESCDMQPITSNTITDPEKFWHELRTVAKQGYAFDNRESSENAYCVAVPVRDCEGVIIAALSFSGIFNIDDTQKLLPYLPILKEASEEITNNLFSCWKR